MSQDRLLSDEEMRNWMNTNTGFTLSNSTVGSIVELFNTQKRLYAESVKTKGHWFGGQKKLDAYHNYAYWCNCGYQSGNREVVDSHIDWHVKTFSRAESEDKVMAIKDELPDGI